MITVKDIEEAIATTRNRWEKMAQCKEYEDFTVVMAKTRCGFCDLSAFRGCLMGLCPLLTKDKSCHPAYLAYDGNESIDKITAVSKQLLRDLDNINKVSLVQKVNKALAKTKE